MNKDAKFRAPVTASLSVFRNDFFTIVCLTLWFKTPAKRRLTAKQKPPRESEKKILNQKITDNKIYFLNPSYA